MARRALHAPRPIRVERSTCHAVPHVPQPTRLYLSSLSVIHALSVTSTQRSFFVNCPFLEKEHNKINISVPDIPAEELTLDPPQRTSTKRSHDQDEPEIINIDAKSDPESTPLEQSASKKAKPNDDVPEFTEQELAAAILLLRKQKEE